MKALKFFLLSTALILVFSTTAFAYIDPSVMTYAIQAIAGLAIAVGAGVAIYFHRIKKKVNKTLNIDENEKKEVEEDIVIIDKSSSEKDTEK